MIATFEAFDKIARLNRDIVVTEKIDGTNAQIDIISSLEPIEGAVASRYLGDGAPGEYMLAGSRSRYITPAADNFGFAKWVAEHAEELWGLGFGRHYGEWWGAGIQRRYGQTTKRFSLFNVARWDAERPACCDVVPTLYRGAFSEAEIKRALDWLELTGSEAAPGFMDPEGVVIYHEAARALFKVTIKGDEKPKGQA